MSAMRPRTPLLAILGLSTLVGIGLAVAATRAPRSPQATAVRTAPARALDCKDLEKRLRACTRQVILAADPAAKERLDHLPPPLARAVLHTAAEELVSRAVIPCEQRRGQVDQAEPVRRCLQAATGPKACEAFGRCLSKAFASHLPPKQTAPAPAH